MTSSDNGDNCEQGEREGKAEGAEIGRGAGESMRQQGVAAEGPRQSKTKSVLLTPH